MSRFLFASIPVPAHTTNPLPFAARLVRRGHEVLWYAGRAFHDRIAEVGATPLPYVAAHDFGGQDMFEAFPQFRGRGGPRVIGEAFEQIFVGHAPQRVADLRAIVAAHGPVDAMLTDGLMYGVGMVGELTGIPWATFGDGPLPFADDRLPPFGPGLLPMRGPVGRVRDALLRLAARRVLFAPAQRRYAAVRADLALPPDPRPVVDVTASPLLHLQGSVPAFEYPVRGLPPTLHWVGALRPDPVRGWEPPSWWGEVQRSTRPVVHVTQGSLRADLTELVVPALRALADEDVLVVVTTGGASRAEVERALGEPVPANARIAAFVPYDDLLARADLFVTNGGYTGVTLALAHGVPIVQAGTTEEKSEVAARIVWSGAGVRLGTTRPSAAKVRTAVRRVLQGPSYAAAARRIAAQMAPHDAGLEGAVLLERLAVTREPVTEPAARLLAAAVRATPAAAPA